MSPGVQDDKVYLVGFMAAGKSTLAGACAASRLARCRHRRTRGAARADAGVWKSSRGAANRTSGPPSAALIGQLGVRHTVVATGGGTFADPQNRALINADGVSVWLDVPIERLIERPLTDGRRPLAADRAEFERLFQSRLLGISAGGHAPGRRSLRR